MKKAVIFDMDGLMIDSEVATYKAYLEVMEPMGYKFSVDQYKTLLGRTHRGIISQFYTMFGDDFPMEQVWDDSHEILDRRILENVPIKKGLIELLKFLKENNYKTIVATSSGRDRTNNILKAADIEKYFDDTICGDEVLYGKPNPEIFLTACKKLGVKEEDAVVLEDSESGIQAAYSGHIDVICVPDMKYPGEDYVNKPIRIVDSLLDVITYLKEEQ